VNIPSELSVTELAQVLGLTRETIRYRLRRGMIPFHRVTNGPRSKRIIRLAEVRLKLPELWDAIVLRHSVLESGSSRE
jgi:excisionase family DNA binding protein